MVIELSDAAATGHAMHPMMLKNDVNVDIIVSRGPAGVFFRREPVNLISPVLRQCFPFKPFLLGTSFSLSADSILYKMYLHTPVN